VINLSNRIDVYTNIRIKNNRAKIEIGIDDRIIHIQYYESNLNPPIGEFVENINIFVLPGSDRTTVTRQIFVCQHHFYYRQPDQKKIDRHQVIVNDIPAGHHLSFICSGQQDMLFFEIVKSGTSPRHNDLRLVESEVK